MNTLTKNSAVLTEPQHNKHYEEYDSINSVSYCTPTYYGFGACVGATAQDGYLVLQLSAKTPIGSYTKNFKITNDISFTWSPISRIKLSLSITNFENKDGYFSFDLNMKICGQIPFIGWKCASYNHHFSVPENQSNLEKLSDQEFSNYLAIQSAN